jgi:hypothetical protein
LYTTIEANVVLVIAAAIYSGTKKKWAINGKNAAAVVRIINGAIASKPDAPVKRRAQGGCWILTYWYRELIHGCVKIVNQALLTHVVHDFTRRVICPKALASVFLD